MGMSNEDQQSEVQKAYRDQSIKYAYYLVALCIAAIGFSIEKTVNKHISITQIPLGMAVISWGFSIYCGLRYVHYNLRILMGSNNYFDVLRGVHPLTGTDSNMINIGKEALIKRIGVLGDKLGRLNKCQFILFSIGAICFLSWHILEMIITK